MLFPGHAGPRARRIADGDRAILYVARGAYHNPTRDDARFTGIVTVTSDCRRQRPVAIGDRDFEWSCRFVVDQLLPERTGPLVRDLVNDLEYVKKPEVWGVYFRQSPIPLGESDFTLVSDRVASEAQGAN